MLQQASVTPHSGPPKKVFISYVHADENAQKWFLMALHQFEAEGRIQSWNDRKILPGEEWDKVINQNLLSADLILFLVSPSFLKSTYCRDVEVRQALARAGRKEAFVIPIILAACDWRAHDFSRLQALPQDGVPLASAEGVLNADLMRNVIEGLRLALLGLWSNDAAGNPHGATIAVGSKVSVSEAPAPLFPSGKLLLPTAAFTPVLLKAVKFDHAALDNPHFITDTGTGTVDQAQLRAEGQKVIDYFWERAAVDGSNDIWVNFSPYESNRMLPAVLSGTTLGRDLLATDCRLKHFAVSLLHPDTETGKTYWRELYGQAKHRFGTSKLPFQSYHKVWISGDRAEVFEKRKGVVFENLSTGTEFDAWGQEENTTLRQWWIHISKPNVSLMPRRCGTSQLPPEGPRILISKKRIA